VMASIIVFLLVAFELVGIDNGDIGKVVRFLERHIAVYFHAIHGIDTAQRIPTRLAFDNHDYPEHLITQVWIDNATEESYSVDTHCTRDHCETAPLMMRKGRQTIRLRVVIGDRMGAFTETTVDR
jgi:hypothetical protein